MATTAQPSQSKQLRRRMQELEDEVSFLKDQNYHIQQVSDMYREKVSQLVAAMRFNLRGTTPLAFAADAELEELLQQLRAHDITHTPQRSPEADEPTGASPKPPLSREDDDGLMHSTSTLSHTTDKLQSDSRVAKSAKGKRAHATGDAAAGKTQRATIARLTAENKNLASLVDSFRQRVTTVTRLYKELEKKFRAVSLPVDRPHGSPSRRRRDASPKGGLSPTQLRKKMRELQEENERLRTASGQCEHLTREVAHYKTLLKRQTAELDLARRREERPLAELKDMKANLAKAIEINQALGTALRLSKVREKRAASARETFQNQQEHMMPGKGSEYLNAFIEHATSEMELHHSLMGEHLLLFYAIRMALSDDYMRNDEEMEAYASKENGITVETGSVLKALKELVAKSRGIGEKMLVRSVSVATWPVTAGGGEMGARRYKETEQAEAEDEHPDALAMTDREAAVKKDQGEIHAEAPERHKDKEGGHPEDDVKEKGYDADVAPGEVGGGSVECAAGSQIPGDATASIDSRNESCEVAAVTTDADTALQHAHYDRP